MGSVAKPKQSEKVAVFILEAIMKRRQYSGETFDAVVDAIEGYGYQPQDKPDWQRRFYKLEKQNKALMEKVEQLRRAKKPKEKPAGTKYDGQYFKGLAAKQGSKIAKITEIIRS